MLCATALALALPIQAPPGTEIIDLVPGVSAGAPSSFTRTSDYVFFETPDDFGFPPMPRAWITDGTFAGTFELPLPGAPSHIYLHGTSGDRTVFSYSPNFATGRLGATDGTTFELFSIGGQPPGVLQGAPFAKAIEFNGRVLIPMNPFGTGEEIWSSDGTNDGTYPVLTLAELGLSGTVNELTVVQERVFFRVDSSGTNAIVSTDGTPGGGLLELAPTPDGLGLLGAHQERLMVRRTDAFWNSFVSSIASGDGVLQGLEHGFLMSDGVDTQGGYVIGMTFPGVPFGSIRVYEGVSGTNQTLMSLVESTPQGPVSLSLNGPYSTGDLAAFFIQRNSTTKELWFTDGTVVGTQLVDSFPSGSTGFSVSDDSLPGTENVLFTAVDSVTGASCQYIGTPAGLDCIPGLAPSSSDPFFTAVFRGLAVLGDRVLVAGGESGVTGLELVSMPIESFGQPTAQSLAGGCAGAGLPTPKMTNEGSLSVGTSAQLEVNDVAPLVPVLWFLDSGLLPTGLVGSCTVALPNPMLMFSEISDTAGTATFNPTIPGNPGFVGSAVRLQGFAFDSIGPAFGLGSLSNVLEVTLGQ